MQTVRAGNRESAQLHPRAPDRPPRPEAAEHHDAQQAGRVQDQTHR